MSESQKCGKGGKAFQLLVPHFLFFKLKKALKVTAVCQWVGLGWVGVNYGYWISESEFWSLTFKYLHEFI